MAQIRLETPMQNFVLTIPDFTARPSLQFFAHKIDAEILRDYATKRRTCTLPLFMPSRKGP
jgi:hypothetical protein